jgi:hypothetical protein
MREVSRKSIVRFKYRALDLPESFWLDGELYFTARAVGLCLGAESGVEAELLMDRIGAMNPHFETTPGITSLAVCENDGGRRCTTQAYTPVGLLAVLLESPRGSDFPFRLSIVHLLNDYMSGSIKQGLPPSHKHLLVMDRFPVIEAAAPGVKRKMIHDLAREIGRGPQTVHRWLREIRETGSLCSHYREGPRH